MISLESKEPNPSTAFVEKAHSDDENHLSSQHLWHQNDNFSTSRTSNTRPSQDLTAHLIDSPDSRVLVDQDSRQDFHQALNLEYPSTINNQMNTDTQSLINTSNHQGGRQDPSPTIHFRRKGFMHKLFNIYLSEVNWSTEEESADILAICFEFSSYLTVTSILSILIAQNILSVYSLFSFSAVTAFGQIVRHFKFSEEGGNFTRRQKRVKYFKSFDAFVLGIWIVVAAIRIQFYEIYLTPFVLPGMISAMTFPVFCTNPASILKMKTTVILKLFFWIQVLSLSLCADGFINTWESAFKPLFYALILAKIIFTIITGISIFYFFRNPDLGEHSEKIFGMCWCILTTIYTWIGPFFVVCLSKVLDGKEDIGILTSVLVVVTIHSIVYLLFIILLKERLFIYWESILSRLIINDDTTVYVESFETVKENIPYLLKVSSTYFTTIHKDFKIKDKQHTKQCKKQIKQVKSQTKSNNPQKKKIFIETTAQSGVGVIDLKSATVELQSRNNKNKNDGKNLFALDNTPGLDSNRNGLCYSDDDAEILDEVQKKSLTDLDEKESSCVVCCINNANAVFMSCGHGGICYDCAIRTWKSGDKCFMCRQTIEAILKVNLVERVNVAKVIESTKKNVTITFLEDNVN